MNHPKHNEARILSHILGMHIEASRFYEETLERVDNPRHHRSLAELERMHTTLAHDLCEHLQHTGHKHISGTTGLFEGITPNVTQTTLDELEKAEKNCFLAMLKVLYDSTLTHETKTLLRDHIRDLQKGQDYMRAMRH